MNLLRKINKEFIDAGFKALIEFPEYANMRAAYEQTEALRSDGRR